MADSYGVLHNLPPSWSWTSLPSSLQTLCVDKMPSIRSLSTFAVSAFGSAQAALGFMSPLPRDVLTGQSVSCDNKAGKVLSCHNKTEIANTCCFEYPGGSILQTQFWDVDPATGPDDSWTLHGLWPDNCDGTYEQYCDPAREYTNISAILQADGKQDLLDYMNTYWASNTGTAESFWEHEWGKHGTCMSTFDPECYVDYEPTDGVSDFFQRAVDTFKALPLYDWFKEAGIVPSTTKTYTLAQLQHVMKEKHGHKVYFGCTSDGELDEMWAFFYVRGSVQTGTFVSATPLTDSSCPAKGIKYLPKGTKATPTTTTTTTGPTSTPTGVFSGKGYLNAITSGNKKGCIISGGTWYTTGTCATFTAAESGDGFTLTSSKGKCAIASGALTCSSSVTDATVFTDDGSDLLHDGDSTFHADAVPTGAVQGTVYTSADGHDVELSIQWQAV